MSLKDRHRISPHHCPLLASRPPVGASGQGRAKPATETSVTVPGRWPGLDGPVRDQREAGVLVTRCAHGCCCPTTQPQVHTFVRSFRTQQSLAVSHERQGPGPAAEPVTASHHTRPHQWAGTHVCTRMSQWRASGPPRRGAGKVKREHAAPQSVAQCQPQRGRVCVCVPGLCAH